MRQLLIVYGTTEGQTRKIAEYLAEKSPEFGYTATIFDAATAPDIELSRFDSVIIAASVHVDRHHPTVEKFIREHLERLKKVRGAFLSVSISAAGDAEDCYIA